MFAAISHLSPSGPMTPSETRGVTPEKASEYRATREVLERLATTLADAAVEVAWAQWSAIGSTASTRRRARSLVDPEALLLLSLALGDRERRLGDLAHDWMAVSSRLVSVQRINNLATDYPESTRAALAVIARTALERGKDFRWKPLAEKSSDEERQTAGRAGQRRGTTRGAPARTNKSRAVPPPLIEPPVLLLRLRLAFGVGIKADTLGFLLGTEDAWASVRAISAATGYTPAAVRRAVEDLRAARVVQSFEETATQYHADAAAWGAVLEIPGRMPVWRSWHERFSFVAAFLDWASRAQEQRLSRYALAVKGRDLLEAHRAAFVRNRVLPWDSDTPASDGAEMLETAVETLAPWMREEV